MRNFFSLFIGIYAIIFPNYRHKKREKVIHILNKFPYIKETKKTYTLSLQNTTLIFNTTLFNIHTLLSLSLTHL